MRKVTSLEIVEYNSFAEVGIFFSIVDLIKVLIKSKVSSSFKSEKALLIHVLTKFKTLKKFGQGYFEGYYF